jgi:hypothetical protein
MALNNRNEQEAPRLKGVNLLDDPLDVEFGTFVQLSNWITRNLYSLSKKRGVDGVGGGAMVPISVINPFASVEVLCGTEAIIACGQQLICSGLSNVVMTCSGQTLVGLAGSEITCS